MKPKLYAKNFKGIFFVWLGSFCLKLPEAAFLGLANLSLIFSKSLFDIYTSPLISISLGKFLSLIIVGISFIVFRFSVINSPSEPSPLETPATNKPFL